MKRRITLLVLTVVVALCTSALWIGSAPAGAKISPTSSPTSGGRILHK
ncbi:MAG: hypothetical protein M3290_08550 [Actinomycetota bacterium]|nr:hypothetical protein [Actinomycetota bacterium]